MLTGSDGDSSGRSRDVYPESPPDDRRLSAPTEVAGELTPPADHLGCHPFCRTPGGLSSGDVDRETRRQDRTLREREGGGRYWIRTSDPSDVNRVL